MIVAIVTIADGDCPVVSETLVRVQCERLADARERRGLVFALAGYTIAISMRALWRRRRR